MQQITVDDKHPRPAVVQDVLHLIGPEMPVDRAPLGTQPSRRQHQLQHLRAVAHQQCKHVAGFQTGGSTRPWNCAGAMVSWRYTMVGPMACVLLLSGFRYADTADHQRARQAEQEHQRVQRQAGDAGFTEPQVLAQGPGPGRDLQQRDQNDRGRNRRAFEVADQATK